MTIQNLQPVTLVPTPEPTSVESRRSLLRIHWYLQPLRRWSPVVLLLAVAVGIGSYFYEARLVKPTYAATATLEVDYPPVSVASGTGGADFLSSEEYATSTAPGLIHNLTVAKMTLKLMAKYLYVTAPMFTVNQGLASAKFPQIGQLYADLGPPPAAVPLVLQQLVSGVVSPAPNQAMIQRKAQRLLSIMSVTAEANGQDDHITVTSTSPMLAGLAANATVTAAAQFESQTQTGLYAGTLQSTLVQISTLTKKLRTYLVDPKRYAGQIQLVRTSIANLRTTYEKVSASAELSAIKFLPTVPAATPTSAISPHPLRVSVAVGAIVLLLLLGGIVLREYFSTTLRTPDEVSEAMGGAPVLGAILRQPASKAPSPNLVSEPRSATAEGLRVIRTNLLFSNVDRPPHLLLLTSARQGEGKTTIASNLAASMSELGGRVLLVDGDLRRPSMGRVFGIDTRSGLTNALVAGPNEPLDGFIKKVDAFPGLSVLPSGPIPPNPAELLSSGRLRDLLQRLSTLYDTIVFDSPPLLAVADPAILSTMTDAAILVIDVNQATLQAATRTREALEQVGSRISGVILNKLSDDHRGGYYYNYYYRRDYGYGYPGADAPKASKGPKAPKSENVKSGRASAV